MQNVMEHIIKKKSRSQSFDIWGLGPKGFRPMKP